MTDREVMQMALECLESLQGGCTDSDDGTVEALTVWCPEVITALRTLLAEPEPEPEPVAWMVYTQDGQSAFVTDNPTDIGDDQRALPLYTAPPARRPLTEKEMYIVEDEARKNFRRAQGGVRGQQITYWDSLTPWLIRATERAHGITGGNDE